MKNMFLIIAIITFLFVPEIYSFPVNATVIPEPNNETEIFRLIDIIRIEYQYIDGQWYQYTYYSDGSIGVQPVNHPPND